MKEIRSTCEGPVEVAIDYMVFNVSNDDIRVSMAADAIGSTYPCVVSKTRGT